MPGRHLRVSPERQQESQVDWMADELVEHGSLEPHRRIWSLPVVEPDLAEAQEIHMTDQQGRYEDNGPTGKGHGPQQHRRRALELPNNIRHGPPLPIQQLQ